jgi:hypothetical protein
MSSGIFGVRVRTRRGFTLAPLLLALACVTHAKSPAQEVGEPLNLGSIELAPVYSNDFSGNDLVEFETGFIEDGKRTRLPDPGAEWIAEGRGGAMVCDGRLWVAPVAFESCGIPVTGVGAERSHMVVWNKNRFPSDMLFEFTVNHHGSDDGLTLVFFAAQGIGGQDIFDLGLPPRNGVYRNYNKGALSNYTVSYWSRNKKPSLVERGEQYTNRIRKNPGANKLSTEYSRTDKCNDCDYRVRILKISGDITVEINGTVVNHVIDAEPYGSGYIGLRNMMGMDKVSYDDFKVWAVE